MTTNPAALSALARGDIANALVASTPGGIERQEAEGQRQMTSSFKTLPKDMDRDTAELFGFVFGEDEDELFVNVTAPDGWQLKPTEHSMHSDVLDELGRKRGGIFYKAAFYDRRATGHWCSRYRIEADYTADYDVTAYKAVDTATGAVLFGEAVPDGDGDKYARRYIAEDAVRTKLAEQFPDYKNVTAYWAD